MTLTRAATRRTRRSEAQRQKQSTSQRKKSAVSANVLTVHAGDMQTRRGPDLGKLEARTRALGPIPGPKDETLKQLVRHYMNNEWDDARGGGRKPHAVEETPTEGEKE